MNLRDLHYLLAVADNRNFKRAAQACHVSQPTLSMQLKKLEGYLGLRLFERTNKSVMITAAGARIAEVARRIVGDERQIMAIARDIHDPRAGEFRLGAIPTLASYVFPSFVPALTRNFPRLQLMLVEEKTERLVEQLKTGRLDAALLALPLGDPALVEAHLFDDAFRLAVGPDHPLAARRQVSIDDLKDHSLLLLNDGHCLRDQALAVCRTHGAREEASFRATSLETLRLMVAAPHSGLMTLMPDIARLPNDRLRYISFRGARPSRRIGLVWRRTSARDAMMMDMAALLRAGHKT